MEKQGIRAGAGKAEIKIPKDYLAAEDFSLIHDPIYARAVVFEGEKTLVIVSVEMTSLQAGDVDGIRGKIAAKLGVDVENIWICATHTFSAPHLLPDHALKNEKLVALKGEFSLALQKAAVTAAESAYEKRADAVLGVGTGSCDINVNRDVELPEGWWLGKNPSGISDKTVSVIRINDREEKPIALIYHYAVQSSVLDHSELEAGGRAVSADLTGQASRCVEEAYPGTTAMFLLGAAGDQSPIEKAMMETFENGVKVKCDLHEKGFEICERLGNELGREVCRIAETISCHESGPVDIEKAGFLVPGKEMNRDLQSLHPVRAFEYIPAEDQDVEIEAVRLGNLAILGVKPELNCITAKNICGRSPFAGTLVATMVNGASKYMANQEAYDIFTYEAMNSPFGRGAAEILTEEAEKLLKKLREK